jgi:CDP-paratose 2-epimerase
MLYVEDLLDAYEASVERIDAVSGEVFNIGGGPNNTISVWSEFGPALEKLVGHKLPVTYKSWRPGDQKVFIADIRKAANQLAWQPKIALPVGMEKLFYWIKNNQHLIS